MKDGLIRLTNEKDIFYDSVEKVYRYRGHCANCGIKLKCQCYEDLDLLLSDIDDDIADTCCSSKCCLLVGDWEELNDVMQSLGMQKDIRLLISNLTDEQIVKEVKGYELLSVLQTLYEHDSNIPVSHLKNPNRDEQIEIIMSMGTAKDLLWDIGVNYYPDIKDLSEEQAKRVLEILTEDVDWDLMPHGDACKT